MRTFLHAGTVVRPDRVGLDCTIVLEGARIVDVVSGRQTGGVGDVDLDLRSRTVVPAFIDAHVHGVAGTDVLEGPGAVGRVAAQLPRWGVAAFCPTSIACPPEVLRSFLRDVATERQTLRPGSARVLAAHLESNFLNPNLRGAQPLEYICAAAGPQKPGAFEPGEILKILDEWRSSIAIVTLAPETAGALDLVARLVAAGLLVSLGHTGATFEEARAAIHAGASRATHLFCAMRPLTHRDPGVVGAVLTYDHIHAELICDGFHVHPAVMRIAIAAKTPERIIAITDGTAASGLPRGSKTRLGNLAITAEDVARLDNGAFGGSVLTMDRAFATLVRQCDVDLVDAVRMCATTPATDLRLSHHGCIEPGHVADLAVLDAELNVVETWIDGRRAWPASAPRV
ncbi:MAG: N-acetylglucosamine-6-phosphate deacetylase [Acidobacteriota bacterium]